MQGQPGSQGGSALQTQPQPGQAQSSQRGASAGHGLNHPQPWQTQPTFFRQVPQPQFFTPPAVAGGGPFTVAITTAQESDTAFAIVASKKRLLGLAAETDTAFVIKPSHVRLIGLAAESDTAFAIGHKKTRLIGLAAESDTAFAIRPSHVKLIGLAGESDTAFVIRPSHVRLLGLAAESDTAFAIGKSKKRLIGLAGESDTAFVITIVHGPHLVGLALEVDTAFPIIASTSGTPPAPTVVIPSPTQWVEVKEGRNPHRPRGLQNRRGW